MKVYCDEAYHYDFAVRNYETFEKEFIAKDEDGELIDLSGKTASAHVRTKANDSTLVAEMTCTIDTEYASITMLLTSDETGAIAPGKYVYDMCIDEDVSGETVRKYLIAGDFYVLPSVTV